MMGGKTKHEKTLNYKFILGSIANKELVNQLFEKFRFDIVVNFAAQARCPLFQYGRP